MPNYDHEPQYQYIQVSKPGGNLTVIAKRGSVTTYVSEDGYTYECHKTMLREHWYKLIKTW